VSQSSPVLILTGAANGIGAAVAQAYAQEGVQLVLLDKDIPGLERTYDQLVEAQPSASVALYPIDFKGASLEDYQHLTSQIIEEFGRLDGLVHCAAHLGQLSPVEHQAPQQWAETLQINLISTYLLTHACLPLIKQQRNGLIIFTSDAHKDTAYWSAYGVSKAGIETLAAQLKDEVSDQGRLHIHCIEPGQVATQLFTRAFPGLDPNQYPSPYDATPPYITSLRASLQL